MGSVRAKITKNVIFYSNPLNCLGDSPFFSTARCCARVGISLHLFQCCQPWRQLLQKMHDYKQRFGNSVLVVPVVSFLNKTGGCWRHTAVEMGATARHPPQRTERPDFCMIANSKASGELNGSFGSRSLGLRYSTTRPTRHEATEALPPRI